MISLNSLGLRGLQLTLAISTAALVGGCDVFLSALTGKTIVGTQTLSPPSWIQGTWTATSGSRTWTFTSSNAIGSAEGDLMKVAADGNREGNEVGVSVRLSDAPSDTKYEAYVTMRSSQLGSSTERYVFEKTGEKSLNFSWYSNSTLKSGPDSFAKD